MEFVKLMTMNSSKRRGRSRRFRPIPTARSRERLSLNLGCVIGRCPLSELSQTVLRLLHSEMVSHSKTFVPYSSFVFLHEKLVQNFETELSMCFTPCIILFIILSIIRCLICVLSVEIRMHAWIYNGIFLNG